MGTVTNDVVLIDDDDDSDLEIQELSGVANGITVEEAAEESKSDDETEPFDVLMRRFLEQDTFIDLVSNEKRSRQTSRCMNPYCKHGENPISAPWFVKSYFGLPNSKDQFVCELCLSDVIKHFQDLDRRFLNNESLFKAEFPRSNPVVLIDSDDEDEPEKEEELSEECKDWLKEHFPDQMMEFFNKSNMGPLIEDGIFSMRDLTSQTKNSLAEAKSELNALERDVTKRMDSLFASFLPKVQENERIDIVYEELRPIMMASPMVRRTPIRVRQIQVENNSSTDVDVLMEKKVASLSVPPEGEIIRPKPKQGQKLLVMKIHTFSEWVPGVVEDVITKVGEGGKRKELYRVKITSGKQSYLKEVEGDTLAYMEPPPVKLGVGTRVIALGSASSNAQKYGKKKFLSGVTGESPTAFNNGRYLVFFDDGYVQYVHHHDLRLVCEPKSNVAEYFQTKTSQEFIRQYLDKYPERHLLKVREMEIIRTECNGQWLNARVKAVDCALVQMLFVKDFRTEWIYRGSTRLHPIFENTKKEIGVFRHRSNTHRVNPVLHYSKIDSSEETPLEEVPMPTRAVAKKSTAMVRDMGYSRNYRSQKVIPDGDIVERDLGNVIRPKLYRPHSCTIECIRWTNYSEEKAKGESFLMIPLFFGFVREKTDYPIHDNRIVYTSPCGKKLRSIKDVHRYLRQTNSELTIDMFDFDHFVNVCDEFSVPERFLKIRDLSYGKEEVAIPCVNCVDSTVPAYMDYRTERKGCEGVFLNLDPNFLTCCDCTDDCADKLRCACWQKTIKSFKAIGRVNNVDPNTIGYQFRRLSEVVTTGIYECNKMCKCSQRSCLNRVVQHPLRQKLQLFKTRRKGWGTRCLNDIPAGSFICVYMGDILTENNANEGGKRYGDEYFAELDFIEVVESLKENYEEDVVGGLDPEDDPDHVDENVEDVDFDDIAPESDDEFEPNEYFSEVSSSRMKLRKRKGSTNKAPESKKKDDNYNSEEDTCSSEEGRQPRAPSNFQAVMPEDEPEKERLSVRSYYGPDESVYIMDAKTAGNIGRYLNHSCDPNIFVQNVFVDTHDLRFPWVAFFALRYIQAGTELTWDYRYEVGSVPGKKLYCYCGSADCRGRLL